MTSIAFHADSTRLRLVVKGQGVAEAFGDVVLVGAEVEADDIVGDVGEGVGFFEVEFKIGWFPFELVMF